jgi:hypothetical protein
MAQKERVHSDGRFPAGEPLVGYSKRAWIGNNCFPFHQPLTCQSDTDRPNIQQRDHGETRDVALSSRQFN